MKNATQDVKLSASGRHVHLLQARQHRAQLGARCRLRTGGLITEGTVGSTGVSLAMVAAARGLRCFIAMPDDAAAEKVDLLRALGKSGTCQERWILLACCSPQS